MRDICPFSPPLMIYVVSCVNCPHHFSLRKEGGGAWPRLRDRNVDTVRTTQLTLCRLQAAPVSVSVQLRVGPSMAQSRQPVMSDSGSISWKDQVQHLAFSEQRTEERLATLSLESVKPKLSRYADIQFQQNLLENLFRVSAVCMSVLRA